MNYVEILYVTGAFTLIFIFLFWSACARVKGLLGGYDKGVWAYHSDEIQTAIHVRSASGLVLLALVVIDVILLFFIFSQ